MACRPSLYALSRLSFIPNTRPFTSAHFPRQKSTSRQRLYALLGLSLSLPAGYYFFQSSPSLSPSVYSDQELKSSKSLTPFHKLVTIKIPSSSYGFFDKPYRLDGEVADVKGGEVVIQHVMVKSPDIQIERPYTLINDPNAANGEREMRMVVKRVRGGEVGRWAQKSPSYDPFKSPRIETVLLEWYILPKRARCLVCEGLYRHSLFTLNGMTKSLWYVYSSSSEQFKIWLYTDINGHCCLPFPSTSREAFPLKCSKIRTHPGPSCSLFQYASLLSWVFRPSRTH